MISKENTKNLIKIPLFLAVGLGILYFVYTKQNQAYQQECMLNGIAAADCNLLKKVYSDFIHSNIFYLFLVIFMFFLSNVSRALRWMMMLKPLGINARFSSAFHSIMLGYFANLGIPRIGEFARAAAFAKRENTKFDKVMGTIVLDRLLDFISLGIVFVLALYFSYDKIMEFIASNTDLSNKFSSIGSNYYFWAIVIIAFLGFIFILKNKKFKNSFIGKKIINFIKGLLEGFKSIKAIEKPGLFIFHSIFIWTMYFMMNYFGFKAFSATANLGLQTAIVTLAYGSLGIVIPSPGGMGTYHFLILEALKLYGINGSDGFSFANIMFFSIQIIGIIFFGILALFFLNKKR